MVECSFDSVLVFASRLAIVACLASGEPMSFIELRKRTGLADGNLHVQARRLEEAGYITSRREAGVGRPRTIYAITSEGRRRLQSLITRLELALERPPEPTPPPVRSGDDDARVW